MVQVMRDRETHCMMIQMLHHMQGLADTYHSDYKQPTIKFALCLGEVSWVTPPFLCLSMGSKRYSKLLTSLFAFLLLSSLASSSNRHPALSAANLLTTNVESSHRFFLSALTQV